MGNDFSGPLAERARRIGLDHWPYGIYDPPEQKEMLSWAELHQVRYSDTNRVCPHWLMAGKSKDIARLYTKSGSEISDSDHYSKCYQLYRFDHVTNWTRDGRPAVLVSQPYGISPASLEKLRRLETEEGMKLIIYEDGWYGNGTWCTEIWAPGVEPVPE